MRTYCKHVNIEDPEVLIPWILDYMQGDSKRPAKWSRYDFQLLMVEHSRYCLGEAKQAVQERDMNVLLEIVTDISYEVSRRIKKRKLGLAPIRFFHRIDGISRKDREISHESCMQQIMDAVDVAALMPLFKAKILPHQYASIRGRGQTNGKEKIEDWVRRDKNSRCFGKADVKKCFPSIKRRVVMRLLRRDIHKNETLLWMVNELLLTYYKIVDGVVQELGLVIGTLLSQWLCNYALSYLYRKLMSMQRIRQSKHGMVILKLVHHALFYMDDILVIGKRLADVKSALRRISVWAKKELELSLHEDWFVSDISVRRIDMMGYVISRNCTIIRRGIYARLRKCYIRAWNWLKHNKRLTLKRAQGIVSYAGYFKHTNSVTASRKLHFTKLVAKAKQDISFYTIVNNKKGLIAA